MPISDPPKRIVVVDDDADIRLLVAEALRRDGFTVLGLDQHSEHINCLDELNASLLIMDIEMGLVNGLVVLESLRTRSEVPVIMLSGLSRESDRVRGLDLGADDYIVKPFMPKELASRVRAVLRRQPLTTAAVASVLDFGDLVIDASALTAKVNGELIALTKLEFALLLMLASSPGEAFSRDRLLSEVWHSEREWQDPETVTEHVSRLRAKIQNRDGARQHLATVRGVGYRFDA